MSEQWKNALTLAHIVCEVRSTHPQSRFEPQLSWTTNHGGRSTIVLYKTFKSIDYRIRQKCRLPLFFCSPPVPDGNLPAQSRCRHGISSSLRISSLIDLAKFSYIWTMIPQLKTLEYNVKGDVSIEGQKVASKKKIPHIVWKIFQMLPSQMFFLAGHCGQLQLHREGPWCFLLCGNKRVNIETRTLIL